MTEQERATLERGSIGITRLNLGGISAPNPPLDQAYGTFEQAKAVADGLNELSRRQGLEGQVHAILFSKRFWSGGEGQEQRYLPDPATGKVDMSGYNYEARPGYVNFDYGLYDEQRGTWWHANHGEPGMMVFESNLETFSRPLLDFDRQVFCVAIGLPGA